jgi:hypothetical protein
MSGGSLVLVDQAAQDGFSADLANAEVLCDDARRMVRAVTGSGVGAAAPVPADHLDARAAAQPCSAKVTAAHTWLRQKNWRTCR